MVVLLAVLVAGWAVDACGAVNGGATAPRDTTTTGRALLAQTELPAQPGDRNHDPNGPRQPWQERLERGERNRLITVAIFLGIVMLGLLVWWGWGKIYHRPRKL
jgi:hypothetical protein